MIPNPKFSVGEEVVLWPRNLQSKRGLLVVIKASFYGKHHNLGNLSLPPKAGWAYMISPDPSTYINDPIYKGWNEKALYPKPRGIGISVEEFMSTIIPIKKKVPA